MNNCTSRPAFTEKENESLEKRKQIIKKVVTSLIALALISLLFFVPQMFFVTSASSEPSLKTILETSGFSNIERTDIETFPAGIYNITLLAEFARHCNDNVLSYYIVESTEYITIFTGPEGATGVTEGYVIPPLSKMFAVANEFGLSMITPYNQYFSEHYLNPDFLEQCQIYKNLDDPKMLLIGFENCYCVSLDRDYNDMVFSLTLINPVEIVNVSQNPQVPNYDEPVVVMSQVKKGNYEIDSVVLRYQIDLGSWNNVTMNLDNTDYVANISAQQYGTLVNYKVYATDTFGNTDVSSIYSYTVADFIAPVISDVIQVPRAPNPGISVTVSAKITEPSGASGIKNATLWFYSNNLWSPINMTFQTGLWKATIPGQASGSIIQLYLKAFDNAGNSAKTSTLSYTVNTYNKRPTADFSAPAMAYTNEVVDFDASASYDADGTIVNYSWNFGDGTTGTGIAVSHSYTNEGEYVVTLTVMDNRATTDSISKTITIENRPPVIVNSPPTAIFTESPDPAYATETITFDASDSNDSDGEIVSYLWDFGDGITTTGVTTTHVYSDDGLYLVELTVTDNEGATHSTITTKYILNNSPVASFAQASNEVFIDEENSFDASESFDLDGTIVAYSWDFGDGTTATGDTATHIYKNSGTYTVALTVTDDDEDTDSVTSTVNVVNQVPVALFTTNTTEITENQGIRFDASESYDLDGTIVSYSWDFGDGTNSTGLTADHNYAEDGDYTVTLIVTDNEGATDSTIEGVSVVAKSEVSLAILSVIVLGITALTATLLYGLFVQRNNKKKSKKTY